jgi:metal-sulfur cluster biosynthetic enzyme
MTNTSHEPHIQDMFTQLQAQLETVYDPEFPVIDIWTLGLIYDITINEEENLIHLLMTFTTPACPMADMIEQMTKNAVTEVYPDREVALEITFDPLRSPAMIRDEDLQRMFE